MKNQVYSFIIFIYIISAPNHKNVQSHGAMLDGVSNCTLVTTTARVKSYICPLAKGITNV